MAAIHRKRQDYRGVVLAAPVTVPYERFSTKSAHHWIARALRALLQTARLTQAEMDGFCLASFTVGPDTAIGLTQHFGLSPRWLDHVPMGGVSGIVSLRRAARAVQSGDADIVACVAGDTNQPGSFRDLQENFSRFSRDAVYPYGTGGANASFALIARHYMNRFGATREDFGKLCVAQRDNALRNPNALMKKPLTLAEYLDARPIADPLCLYDCVMPCAGAEAFLVMHEDRAAELGLASVDLLGTVERHNAFSGDVVQFRGGWAVDADELYAMADTQPDDIDFVQTYDDYPVISMMQFEDLGFCGKGEGPDFVRAHDFTIGGDIPHNTSGGQLSVGQAGAAGGHLGLVEAIRQLLGEAGGMQVASAARGLVSGFGMINYDRGLASGAAILGRRR